MPNRKKNIRGVKLEEGIKTVNKTHNCAEQNWGGRTGGGSKKCKTQTIGNTHKEEGKRIKKL